MSGSALNSRAFEQSPQLQMIGTQHEVAFDPHRESFSERLVTAVAAVSGTEPTELPILANYLDPDALDTLIRSDTGSGGASADCSLSFRYHNYDVYVETEGRMYLSEHGSAGD